MPASTTKITVRYASIDRFSQSRTFTTLAGARRFAQKWVGEHPDMGRFYAVSFDGVGKVTVSGATLAELFPDEGAAAEAAMDRRHDQHHREIAEMELIECPF